MSSDMEEIEDLIARYRLYVGDWATSLSDQCWEIMDRAEQELRDKIQAIITERDAAKRRCNE